MGGGHGEPRPIRQGAQQSCRQSRAFAGIRSGSHFVQQHQSWCRTGTHRSEDAPDALHMATEGGEALLQGLFITDVSEHLRAPGERRNPTAGKPEAGTGHQCRKTQALEGDCFAAGVGTGDRHHPQRGGHIQTHRDNRRSLVIALLPHQQGVTEILEGERRIL